MTEQKQRELVKRLRHIADEADYAWACDEVLYAAADLIETLTRERDEARKHHIEWTMLHQQEVDNAHRQRMAAERERDEARRDAREECARLCMNAAGEFIYIKGSTGEYMAHGAEECAARIRALSSLTPGGEG